MRVMGHLQLSEPWFGVADEGLNQSVTRSICHLAAGADVDAYATGSPVVHRCRVSRRRSFQPGWWPATERHVVHPSGLLSKRRLRPAAVAAVALEEHFSVD